jgi:hypothetical protein
MTRNVSDELVSQIPDGSTVTMSGDRVTMETLLLALFSEIKSEIKKKIPIIKLFSS